MVSASSFFKEKQHKHWSTLLPIYQNLEKDCCWVAKLCPTLLRPHGLYPTRIHCPCDSPSKNTGLGCHFLLQGLLLTQGSNLHLLGLLHWQADTCQSHQWSPLKMISEVKLRHSWLNLKKPRVQVLLFFTTFPCLPSSRNKAMIFWNKKERKKRKRERGRKIKGRRKEENWKIQWAKERSATIFLRFI